MGKHLNRAKLHFGTDTRGLLEGRPLRAAAHPQPGIRRPAALCAGDDVRDIDWKASARSDRC